MKTIEYKRGSGAANIHRVSDGDAFDAVDRKGVARYIPKRIWKQKVRDAS